MGLVLTVLAVGLVVGVLLVWRLARGGAGAPGPELERADLERRQEELYQRLRAAHAMDDAERAAELEHQAALNLRDLEALGDPLLGGKDAGRASSTVARQGSAARSGVIGFVAGLAVAGLLVALFYWAQRDARPRPAQPLAEGQEHPAGMELSDAQRAELERLRAAVERAPGDVSARKRYALALLATGQLFPAFEQGREILAASPEDPDGLYITAFVRLEMGQTQVAVDLFDRLLVQHPRHIPALVGKGLARARSGDLEEARALWLQALEASGGDNPQVERLLAALDESTSSAPPEPGPVYAAVVRLAEKAAPSPTAVLFVSLRSDAGGPPAAVRRVVGPTFPLEVTLSSRDSMLGRPLPESGTLTARLDGDGNASTRQPGDLEGTATGRRGGSVDLLLSD